MRGRHGRAAFAFIFVTVALDMLALGVIIPVLPRLILQFQGGDAARAALAVGVFGATWGAMQFLFSPVLGALSDRWGRRPVVLLSNLGLGLDYALMAWAPSLPWLFAGRVASGVTASSLPTAFAYISDVTEPERRAARFGMVGAAFGFGFVAGPALGGLLGGVDLRLPFWVAGGLSLANAAYGFFILPESLPLERRSPFLWSKANPVASLSLLRSHPELSALAAAMFLYYFAHESLPSAWVLYTDFRYAWGPRAVGLSLAAIGLCSAAVSAAVVGPAVKRFGERRSLAAGLLFGAAGFAGYGLARSGGEFAAAIPVFCLWGLVGPSLQALMTRRVDPSEQGRLQGALTSMRGVTDMIGPLFFTRVFAAALRSPAPAAASGAPFLIAAALLVASLAASSRAAD